MSSKPIAIAVVAIVGIFALVGLYMTYDLVKLDKDAALIAIFSGLTGTALGYIGGILGHTEKPIREQTVKTEIVNSPDNPVPVQEEV